MEEFEKQLSSLVWELEHTPVPYESTIATIKDGDQKTSRFCLWGRFFDADTKYVSFDFGLEEIPQTILDEEKKICPGILRLTPVGFNQLLHTNIRKPISPSLTSMMAMEHLQTAMYEEYKFLLQVKKPPTIDNRVQFPSPYRFRLMPGDLGFKFRYPLYGRNIGGYAGVSECTYLPKDMVANFYEKSSEKFYDILIKGYTIHK